MLSNTAYPDGGTTMRQPATTIFGIDSADRYTFDAFGQRTDRQPEYNFKLYKNQTVLNGFIKRLGLTEVNMEWNVPNVNEYNNKFYIGITSPDISNNDPNIPLPDQYIIKTTVPTGFYTPTELAATLQTLLNTDLSNAGVLVSPATADIKVTIDPVTLYVILQADISGSTGLFFPPTEAPGYSKIDVRNTTLYEMLGLSRFLRVSAPLSVLANTVVGSYASYLYTRYIDITSENLTKKQEVKDSSTQPPEIGASNLLARIYIPSNPQTDSRFDVSGVGCNIVGTRPFVLYREIKNPKFIYWDSREFINLIDIKVYDDKGRPLFEQADDEVGVTSWISGNTAEFELTILASEN